MIASNPSQTFPIDLAGYTTIAQHWSEFRCFSVAEKDSTEEYPAIASTSKSNCSPKISRKKKHNAEPINTIRWRWPNRPVIFISDPHADAQAFVSSLVASGGVTQTVHKKAGKRLKSGKIKLTRLGKKATFVIGGDCLDKGPSNLDMLRSLKQLIETGADVKLIAGNHDLRLLTGLAAISRERHVGSEHMFVRMGSKVMPLFREVFDTYLVHKNWQKNVPTPEECKAALFPTQTWYQDFPEFAAPYLSPRAIEKEVRRLQKKAAKFDEFCQAQDLTVQMVYAAAQKCHQLFFKKSGEFSWFFRKMQLAYKKGSFLFVHAGLDDSISQQIQRQGIKTLNRRFKKALREDLFAFYFSSLATPFRTKYRDSDPIFTGKGAKAVKLRGIYCVVHGHVSHADGQQISLHKGLLHVEGDITLDRNSRRKEGLAGIGFGATIIHPKQMIIGISSDHPVAKVLSPKWHDIIRERVMKEQSAETIPLS